MDLSSALSQFISHHKHWSLDSITSLLHRLDNPQRRLPPVIHIAGTNGKGSTTAFLFHCLQAAGLRVHRYISPHLCAYTERITIAGQEISQDQLVHYLSQCADHSDLPISIFEALTASAFLAFAEHPADITLMEVGLGGRLDATNVLPYEEINEGGVVCASVITSISLDHHDTLGHTLESIAAEKSAILRPHIPCISAPQPREVTHIIEEKASSEGSPLYQGNQHWYYHPLNTEEPGRRGIEVHLWDETSVSVPRLGLIGDHQCINAALTVATLKAQSAVSISDEAITQGLAQAQWPGRLQRISQKAFMRSFPEGSELWVDGAHNEGGAHVLRHHIQTYWNSDLPLILVIGMLARKDCRSFWEIMAPLANQRWIIQHFSDHAVTSAETFRSYTPALSLRAFSNFDQVIHNHDLQEPARLLFCGSLYLMGEILCRK